MPKFFKRDLFSNPLDPEHELASPLDTPELPEGQHHYENPNNFSDFDPVEVLLYWRAPARPYRKRDRSFYTTIAIIIILISLIAILAGEMVFVVVLLALGFLIYVLNFVAPEEVDYKLSTQGVTIGEQFYHWEQLDSFWFSDKDGIEQLCILTDLRFPGMLYLVLKEDELEMVKRICARYLPFHEIAPKTMVEKWSESLQKHFPLENPHK